MLLLFYLFISSYFLYFSFQLKGSEWIGIGLLKKHPTCLGIVTTAFSNRIYPYYKQRDDCTIDVFIPIHIRTGCSCSKWSKNLHSCCVWFYSISSSGIKGKPLYLRCKLLLLVHVSIHRYISDIIYQESSSLRGSQIVP